MMKECYVKIFEAASQDSSHGIKVWVQISSSTGQLTLLSLLSYLQTGLSTIKSISLNGHPTTKNFKICI